MMKSFFKKLAFVMALAMVVSLAAPAATTAAAAENLQIAYQNGSAITELNIAKVDGTEDLRFLGAKTMKSVVWESDNTAVATVNEKGIVTAKADGTANITVTVDGLSATVKVYCVTLSENKATIGSQDGTQRSMSTHTMKVDETFDFRFFGIKDYDAKRYECTWKSLVPEVADVDKNGVVTAYKPGTAALTLVVLNTITGKAYVVDSCVITVEAEEPVATATPVAEPEITVAQKTEKSFELTFNNMNVDIEKVKKNEIEVYEYHVDEETGVEHYYIWQIAGISEVEDKEDTILVTGYATNELIDEQKYVVKYVIPNADEELVEDVVEPVEFTASVGAVDRVESSYRSYQNNQGGWTFSNIAYTTENYGEEIPVDVEYKLYDDENIDVTGHYLRLNDNKNLVTLDLVTEEAEDTYEFFGDNGEQENRIVFTEIPETSYVVFNVVYEDEDGNEVVDELRMVVKEAIDYHVTNVDHWAINIKDGSSVDNNKDYLKQWVALYDDYDVADMEPRENHEIVLWISDNYGNAWVTNNEFVFDKTTTKYNGMKHKDIADSEQFSNESFELYYETRNPQTLVVGDEYDELTTSNIITTKKTGTATINVSLHDEDGLVDRIDSLKIQVKAARYLKSAKANTSTLAITSDSIATGAAAANVKTDGRDGDDNKYDKRWTEKSVTVKVTDNHGDAFGIYNDTLAETLSVDVETEVTAFTTVAESHVGSYNAKKGEIKYTFYGPEVAKALNGTTTTTETKAEVELTFTDEANDKEVKEDFKVSLKEPNYFGESGISNIKVDEKVDLRADGTYGYTATEGLVIPVKVVETSDGLDVNYCDRVELLDTKTLPDDFTAGDMFIYVLDPKGKVIPTSGDFYMGRVEDGYYEFHYAKENTSSADEAVGTRFATTGTYSVKFITIDEDGDAITKTEKFKLVDDRLEFEYAGQDYIYVDDEQLSAFESVDNGDEGIDEIAANAFSYVYKGTTDGVSFDNKPVEQQIGGVRFNVNKKANAVVVKDVFFRVRIDVDHDGDYDEGVWYYVEVEIPDGKTVSLESLSRIGNSVDYRYDPAGMKMQ